MTPILGKDFAMPADGLFHLAPEGEFIHKKTGLRQIIDRAACEAITAEFAARAAAPDFAGVLVDYDHESLDIDKRTEAAGWLQSVEHRPGSGLWGRIRWTDDGEAAVRGGRYRFLSPVWNQDECEDLGDMKVRPLKILNLAVTNNPQLTGAAPLSNSIAAGPAAVALIANRALANALMPGNDRQRRAVFAKLHGAPLAAQPKTSEELDAEEQAANQAAAAERQRRLDLAKIIARRKAIEADQARPRPWQNADEARKAAGVGVAKPAGKVKVADNKTPTKEGGRTRIRSTDQLNNPAGLVVTARPIQRTGLNNTLGAMNTVAHQGALATRGTAATTDSSRTDALLRQGMPIAQWLATLRNREPMTDQQRKAMFARMRGSSGAGRSWGADRTSFKDFASGLFQIATGSFAKDRNLSPAQQKNLARLDTAVNAAGGIVPSGIAESGLAQARSLIGKAKPGYRANFDALQKIDDTIATLKAEAVAEKGYIAEDVAEQIRALRAQADRLRMMPAVANRGGPMNDDQRKAMFARMDNYRGRTSPASKQAGGAASPAVPGEAGPSPSPSSPGAIDHSPTRDSAARIEALYAERANLEAAAPRRPEPPASLAPVDPKQAQADAMKAGKDAGEVLAAVQAAQRHNAAAAAEMNNIAASLKAKGVKPDRLADEIQKELDRRAKDYQKALDDFAKADARHTAALQAIDKKIGDEEIRKGEEDARAAQLAANDRARAAVAADKAAKAEQLAAARKAETEKAKADAAAAKAAKTQAAPDPIKENSTIKRRNRAYAEALLRGDVDLAERLSPGADHQKNAATVRDLLPDPEDPASARNSKALAGILSTLERTSPRDYSRL